MAESVGVVVRLPQSLAEFADGRREVVIDMGGPATLGAVLAELRRLAPGVARRVQDETGTLRRYVNVFVDDEECRRLEGLATQVAPGQVLYVIPSVAGG